jgi:perosamine synthetase
MSDTTQAVRMPPSATEDDPIAFSRPYLGKGEVQAAAAVLRSGWIVGGAQLAAFEHRFAELCGAAEAVGVSSWTTGAFLVLHALGIGPGDEVIVPSLTFIASVNVIRHAGATPVFADVDPETYNIDPHDVAQKVTARTRAILPVDQLGLPCEIDRINEIAATGKIRVIDDAACAFGSRNRNRPVGSLAYVTIFSMHARKVVTTGEGGMIVTNDRAFAERLRRLRHQGMSLSDFARHNASPIVFEEYPEIGFNFRITDIQAAVGLAQLDRLDDILARRRAVAEHYQRALAGHPVFIPPHVPAGLAPNWQSYQIALRSDAPVTRNAVMECLHTMGIPTRRGVMASHLEPPYSKSGATLPNTERLAATTLQLPIHPALTRSQQDRIVVALGAAITELKR